MSSLLVEAAKRLASDKKIMDSYWEYHEGIQNWFFSPNANLDNAEHRPYSFPSPNSWKRLTSNERKKKWNNAFSLRQKMTLTTLAGFGYEGKRINLDSSKHFNRLREAYMNWSPNLYSVFWKDGGNGKSWLCNVFVGDAIYLCNGKSFTSSNNHYYDPKQIYAGSSFLSKRNSYKDVKAGDICVFGSHHVEIITSVQKNLIADDGFCSIGAGRGGNKGDMGLIKCDSFFSLEIPVKVNHPFRFKVSSVNELF